MLVHLIRYKEKNRTLGVLIIGDTTIKTLELPWKNNELNVSCLADGIYRFIATKSNNKGRYVIELICEDTKPRSNIQIHVARLIKHLKGCIGVGSRDLEKLAFNLMKEGGSIMITSIN